MVCLRRQLRRVAAAAAAVPRKPSAAAAAGSASSAEAKNSSTSSAALSYRSAAALAALSLSLGFAAGRSSSARSFSCRCGTQSRAPQRSAAHLLRRRQRQERRATTLTAAQKDLKHQLARLVGADNVLDGADLNPSTAPYLQGARLGQGRALCIVAPRRLHHVQQILELCLKADCVVLPQGQNTGLTGGSVPRNSNSNNDSSNRPVVVLSLKHLTGIFPIDDGKRVVCLAGTGLATVRTEPNRLSSC